jgi:hypothetical protein
MITKKPNTTVKTTQKYGHSFNIGNNRNFWETTLAFAINNFLPMTVAEITQFRNDSRETGQSNLTEANVNSSIVVDDLLVARLEGIVSESSEGWYLTPKGRLMADDYLEF